MICGHCKTQNVSISHVKACSDVEQHIRTIGTPREAESFKALVAPAPERPKPQPVTEPGVYFDGEHYYKVVQNQSGTRLYAKIWDGAWEYAPGALFSLTADQRVNADQAAKFGKLWGQCVFCSRLLTDERSVAVGYGPTCATNNGLPWGEVSKPIVSVQAYRPYGITYGDAYEPNVDHTED